MKSFTCTQSQSLRDFTDATYPQGSFCFRRLLRAGDIKVNGVRTKSDVHLNAGDVVVYFTTAAQESAPSHNVIYEDENILVADKFSGVSCEGLSCELNGKGVYYPVHRLDRNTCGVLVFAKTPSAEKSLLGCFRTHGLKKTYLAVCKDNFKQDKQVMTAYLKKKEDAVAVSAAPLPGGVKIITEYSVLKRQEGLALVQVILHTGKTHQIRAHMAKIGCPVLGDNKYGDEQLNKRYNLARQCLVAKRLQFIGAGDTLDYLNGKTFESGFGLDLDRITERAKY